MSRYIDADALKDRLDYCVKEGMGSTIAFTFKHMVDDAPTIEIIRCRECKYWHKNRKEGDGMNVFDVCYDFQADDFCSYGERESE